jgi:hypothetical protein
MSKQMVYIMAWVGIVSLGTAAWVTTSRAGYESAEYRVIEKDGKIEIREYPDLMLVSTDSKLDAQGRDGSFMRLFRYISGDNEDKQKIAMTTPVFMEGKTSGSDVSMGFVMPKDLAAQGVPEPKSEGVQIRKREGGRFAVIRFSGRLNSSTAQKHEAKLREWMKTKGLEGVSVAESAGYDPPFTPGPLRRNEVLIRIQDSADSSDQPSTGQLR